MKKARPSRRNGLALAGSAVFHILVLVLILQQASPIYDLPQPAVPPEPPVDAQIVELEPPLRPVIVPRLESPQEPRDTPPQTPPRVTSPPQPQPQPPKSEPAPPTPAPTTPSVTPKPAPAPIPVPPKPVIQAPTPPRPAPVAPLATAQRPAPVAAPTPPAPPAPAVARAPPAPAPPIRLNIHKPDKEAPGNVATLPLAPAPSPAAPGGGQRSASAPAGGGEPELGGSRLQGLTPYPYGSMPSGGSGLRGSLIGCANAEAVSLSAVERARCNARFGADAAAAPALDLMSPTKRAAFDKAAAENEANRKYRAAVPTGTTPGKPGFGAGLGPDQPQRVRDMLNHPQ